MRVTAQSVSILGIARTCVQMYDDGLRPLNYEQHGDKKYPYYPEQADYDQLKETLGRDPTNKEIEQFENYFADIVEALLEEE